MSSPGAAYGTGARSSDLTLSAPTGAPATFVRIRLKASPDGIAYTTVANHDIPTPGPGVTNYTLGPATGGPYWIVTLQGDSTADYTATATIRP